MGFLSKLKGLTKVIDDVNNMAGKVSKATVEDYGKAEYSLYTALNLGDLHSKIDISHIHSRKQIACEIGESYVVTHVTEICRPAIKSVNDKHSIVILRIKK